MNNPTHVLSNDAREATPDEAAVLKAMNLLSQISLSPSRIELEAMTEAALSYSHSDGRIESREAFIDGLVSGQSVFKGIELRDISVQLAGDIAVIRHHALYNTFNKGTPGLSDIQICQVWQRRQDVWRLLLRQARKTSP